MACLLLSGLLGTPEAFLGALLLSIVQSVLFFARQRAFKAFPVQLRLAYTVVDHLFLSSDPLVLLGARCRHFRARHIRILSDGQSFRSCRGIAQSRLRRVCCAEHFCPDRDCWIGKVMSPPPDAEPACAPLKHRWSQEPVRRK